MGLDDEATSPATVAPGPNAVAPPGLGASKKRAPAKKAAPKTSAPKKSAGGAKQEDRATGVVVKKRSDSGHPKYLDMVKDAILALKSRSGSSRFAIAKYIEDKYPDLTRNWKKTLSVQLRNLVASGKLAKEKASYKLSDNLKAPSVKVLKSQKSAKAKPSSAAAVTPAADAAAPARKAPAGRATKPQPAAKKSKVEKAPEATRKRKAPVEANTAGKPAAKKAKEAAPKGKAANTRGKKEPATKGIVSAPPKVTPLKRGVRSTDVPISGSKDQSAESKPVPVQKGRKGKK